MARPITSVDSFALRKPHRGMRGALPAATAALLLAVLGCSSTSPSTGPGGGGSGATGGAGGATNATCQAIRICAFDCADETCVMDMCKPRGTAAAQTTFQALYDCTKDTARGACASPADANCVCLAQCLQDPPCVAEAEACLAGAAPDIVCEDRCH
jgi:hypothetical protein